MFKFFFFFFIGFFILFDSGRSETVPTETNEEPLTSKTLVKAETHNGLFEKLPLEVTFYILTNPKLLADSETVKALSRVNIFFQAVMENHFKITFLKPPFKDFFTEKWLKIFFKIYQKRWTNVWFKAGLQDLFKGDYENVFQTIEIRKNTQRRSLTLKKEDLRVLPENIGLLTNLEVLTVQGSHTEIKGRRYKIPGALRHLPHTIENLKKLKKLNLKGNKLEDLPEAIGQLENLEILCLQKNCFKRLPTIIGNLKRLQELNLGHNKLQNLPEAIGQLKSLETLGLEHNWFEEIPAVVWGLTRLQNLYFHENQLSEIPHTIANLTELKVLVLADNQFSIFPSSLEGMTNLKHLDLAYNKLTCIPFSTLNSLTQLEYFYLENNFLSTFPAGIATLVNLKELDLNDNELKKVPSIGYFTSLTKLYLRHNNLTFIASSIRNKTHLKDLDLAYNKIEKLPSEFSRLTQLDKLYIDERLVQSSLSVLASLRCGRTIVYPISPEHKPHHHRY